MSLTGIQFDELQDLINTLMTELPSLIIQLVIGLLTFDPELVYTGLSSLLPILFKLLGKAAFWVIKRQNKK